MQDEQPTIVSHKRSYKVFSGRCSNVRPAVPTSGELVLYWRNKANVATLYPDVYLGRGVAHFRTGTTQKATKEQGDAY